MIISFHSILFPYKLPSGALDYSRIKFLSCIKKKKKLEREHLGSVWIIFFHHSSLITHHLKYPTHLAPSFITHHSIFFTLFVGSIPVTRCRVFLFFILLLLLFFKYPNSPNSVKKKEKKEKPRTEDRIQ